MMRLARAGEFTSGLILLYFASAFPVHGASAEERLRATMLVLGSVLALVLAFRLGRGPTWRKPAALLSVLTMLWTALTVTRLMTMATFGPALRVVAILMLSAFVGQACVAVALYRSRSDRVRASVDAPFPPSD